MFPLPDSPPLAAFAKSLWDREMRTAFIATTSRRGECLLRIVDSRHLDTERALVLVTQQARQSVYEALRAGDVPSILRRSERAQLWEEFNRLLQSLFALHSAGLMHRNISLESIYVSAEQDGPQFRIGDYSWTVYLHNLARYLRKDGKPRVRDQSYWTYRAPELRKSQQLGESFATDLYALGCAMAGMLCLDAQTVLLDKDASTEETDILDFVKRDRTLTELERLFFTSMLAADPSNRFENALRASEFALQIVRDYGRQGQRSISTQLTVSFDLRGETKTGKDNMAALAKWVDVEGLAPRINEFLESDLTNVDVYTSDPFRTDSENIPRLYIRGNSGIPYSLMPYNDFQRGSRNLEVAVMRALRFDPKNVPETPIARLENGVVTTRFAWEKPRAADSWAPLFVKASETIRENIGSSAADLFRDNLWRILDAEKALVARRILPVRITSSQMDQASKTITARLELRPRTFHPNYPGWPPETFERWLSSVFKERELTGFLTEEPAVEEFPASNQRVAIGGLGKDGLLEVELGEKSPATEGQDLWLKPGGIISTIYDLRKKRRALRTAHADDYLIQVLTNPEQNTVFLDPMERGELWEKILHTRPLFVVQGPPGCGKTFTATNVILTALREGIFSRILVVAQAHDPLDHLMREVRQAILEANLSPAPMTVRLAQKDKTEWGLSSTQDRDRDLSLLTKQLLQRASRWEPKEKGKQELVDAWQTLIGDELENPSPAWTDLILRSANVVFTTAMSPAIETLGNHPPFDLVIVEEAAKAYPTELLGSLRLGRNWLLIGDQMQLPPYQFNEMEAAALRILENSETHKAADENVRALIKAGLQKDIRFFGSLHESMKTSGYPFKPPGAEKPAVTLTTQRRLPPEISNLISKVFYKQPFTNATAHRVPVFLEPVSMAKNRLIWIDCPFASDSNEFRERRNRGGGFNNPGEAALVARLLAEAKLRSGRVVILSPYSGQVNLLKDTLLRNKASIASVDADAVQTVDSFQGQEADLVIVSMVRNNLSESPSSALGFLRSAERMNVILSRARCQLVIVGALRMLTAFDDPSLAFMRELDAYVRANALILTPAIVGLRR